MQAGWNCTLRLRAVVCCTTRFLETLIFLSSAGCTGCYVCGSAFDKLWTRGKKAEGRLFSRLVDNYQHGEEDLHERSKGRCINA